MGIDFGLLEYYFWWYWSFYLGNFKKSVTYVSVTFVSFSPYLFEKYLLHIPIQMNGLTNTHYRYMRMNRYKKWMNMCIIKVKRGLVTYVSTENYAHVFMNIQHNCSFETKITPKLLISVVYRHIKWSFKSFI